MMMANDLFFDLDRTLWDFDSNSHQALSIIFDTLQLDQKIEKKKAFISDYKRINEKMWEEYRLGKVKKEALRTGRFQRALLKHGIDDVKLAATYAEEYLALCPHLTDLFPGTIEVLNDFKSRGKKMHIITNGFTEVQHIKLEKSGLRPFFDFVICSDTLGINKPDPRIFHHALKHAEASIDSAVMIGDHLESDVLGAHGVGMQGILFDPKDEHKKVQSVKKIKELAELPAMIW
jgi:putative hydrolase of the HAD superfamily